ncbi:MAG: PspC domain-containing protein [Herpetosiphon sp.]
MQTQLVRSQDAKVIAGVSGGVARYFNIDPVLVRLGFIFLSFASGAGLLLYLALWLVMPMPGQQPLWNQALHNAQNMGQSMTNRLHAHPQPRFDPQTGQPLSQPITIAGRNQQLGYVLLAVGGLMLASFADLAGPFIAVSILGTGYYLLRKRA